MSAERLFCKPLPGMKPAEILFFYQVPGLSGAVALRSFSHRTDLSTVHGWVNQPYSRRFWQMQGDQQTLADYYSGLLHNPRAHVYMALFNNRPVGLLELSMISEEELKDHLPPDPGACAVHILLQPPRESLKGLSEAVLVSFTRFYFSFSAATILYGEPDHLNSGANLLARRAGFQFLRELPLKDKTANLYSITKQQCHASYSFA